MDVMYSTVCRCPIAIRISRSNFFVRPGHIFLEMNLTLQMGMEAFGGVAPSYIILLREKPTLWWHFNSLQQGIHMMLAFMLADEKNPLRLCKYCHKAFIVTEEDSWFCKSDCEELFKKKA